MRRVLLQPFVYGLLVESPMLSHLLTRNGALPNQLVEGIWQPASNQRVPGSSLLALGVWPLDILKSDVALDPKHLIVDTFLSVGGSFCQFQ